MADNRTENDALIEVARDAHGAVVTDPASLHLSPAAQHVVDLERFLPAPRRTRATVRHHTAASLSAYVNRHKAPAATTLYANAERAVVHAVLNDSALDAPGWGDHRAVLELKTTDAWGRWKAGDGRLMNQQEFAEHIEAGLAEIVEPPSADMLELAQTFEATTGVNFRSATRLADGQRALLYEETVEARAGLKGSIEIPKEFRLAIEPYEGSGVAPVIARLRYRINGIALSIGYVLVRPADVLRVAFDEAVGEIEQATELQAFRGTPPERPA